MRTSIQRFLFGQPVGSPTQWASRPLPGDCTHSADTLGMATSNAVAATKVSKENQERYDYASAEIGTELAPLFQFPEEGKGYTTSEDWNDAWNRVQAA